MKRGRGNESQIKQSSIEGEAGSSPWGHSNYGVTLGAAPHGGQRAGVFSPPPRPHGPWLRAASAMSGFPGTSDSPCRFWMPAGGGPLTQWSWLMVAQAPRMT